MVGADSMSNRTVAEGYVENYATLLRAQCTTEAATLVALIDAGKIDQSAQGACQDA